MNPTQRPKILALDDDAVWLEQIPLILEDDADVKCLATIDQGLNALEAESFDLVLLDLNFADDPRTGLSIFRRIHAIGCGADVIVISGETNPERLVEICNAGITRFIAKPATPDRIRQEVRRVLEQRDARKRSIPSLPIRGEKSPFLGSSLAIQKLRQEVEWVLRSGVRDILIQGETGTGKEILARYLAASFDRSGRFFPVHCGAISDGLIESELFGHVKGAFTGADRDRVGVFEAAAGGVVFLDEIGEMPLHQQAKLLRVLQERKVQRVGSHQERPASFRTVAATHVDLKQAIAQKSFREDLYFRIAQGVVHLPSLRDRPEDIPQLVDLFLNDVSGDSAPEITEAAMRLLVSYSWPGNIRELEAVIRNLVFRANGSVIREKDVCHALPEVAKEVPGLTRAPMGSYAYSLLVSERRRFENALKQANGYRDEAAKILGVSRATFFRRAKELGVIRNRSRAQN